MPVAASGRRPDAEADRLSGAVEHRHYHYQAIPNSAGCGGNLGEDIEHDIQLKYYTRVAARFQARRAATATNS